MAGIWGRLLTPAYNWHWIEKPDGPGTGLARSAQLYAFGGHAKTLLRHHGVRHVLNLRGENAGKPWFDGLKTAADDLGIDMNSLSFSSRRLPDRDTLLGLLDQLDRNERPMLMLCSGGADRTSFAAALAVLHARGADGVDTAHRHLRPVPYFHIPKREQRWIRQFFRWFLETRGGRPLRQWVEETYDPNDFAAWLKANGMDGYWRD